MNKYQSCHGCPDRSADCHGRCEGYQFRRAQDDKLIADRVRSGQGLTWTQPQEMERRITNARDRRARRRRA